MPNNQFPIEFGSHTSNCLLCSTTLFLLPTIYAFSHSFLQYYGMLSLITTLISWNHWRHGQINSIARKLDLVCSKLAFGIYFVSGWIFMSVRPLLLVIALPSTFFIIQAYRYSTILWNEDNSNWVYAHMIFHLFVAYTKCIVLYSGVQYYMM